MDTDKKKGHFAICVHLWAKLRRLTAIRNPLVCQAQQGIAAAAHLNGDFPQRGTLKSEAGRLAVNRAAQVADFLRGAFPEILHLLG